MRASIAAFFSSIVILILLNNLISLGATPSEKEFVKALDLMEKKSLPQAIKILETLITKSSTTETKSRYYYVAATCYRRSGNWKKAISYYQFSAKDNSFLLADLTKLNIAKGYETLKDYKSAIEWYEKVLRDHPGSFSAADAQYQIGECYSATKQYEKAIDQYRKFVEDYPEGDRARETIYKIGETCQKLNRCLEAYADFQRLIRQNVNDSITLDALVKIKLLITSCPQIIITREDRIEYGMALFNAKQYKAAREELKKTISGTDDLSAKTSYFIARTYHQEGKYSAAVAEYIAITKRYPKSDYAVLANYQFALCQKKIGKERDYSTLLAKFTTEYPESDLADDARFELAEYYMGKERRKEALEAYSKVIEQYPTSDLADDALWYIGWYNLKLKNNDKSEQAFLRLINEYPDSQFAGPARLWAGVSCERLGKWQEAFLIYKASMQKGDWYYSYRAKKRAELLIKNRKIPEEMASIQYRRAKIDESVPAWRNVENPISDRIRELLDLRIFDDAVSELMTAVETGLALENAYYNLSVCYRRMGNYNTSWSYAWTLSQLPGMKGGDGAMPSQVYRMLYPIAYRDAVFANSEENKLDPFLVLALMFEESRHNPVARSRAGAMGIMQIMPYTGRDIARKIDITKFDTEMLRDPDTNIKMGTWHLSCLMTSLDKHIREILSAKESSDQPSNLSPDDSEIVKIMALGAYNAGEGRIRRWIQQYSMEDIDEFIESIPFRETKRYIMKVCDSYAVYKSLYDEEKPILTD